MKKKDILPEVYEKYTSSISTKGMAASLNILYYMYDYCITHHPDSILDLGSGISSVMFSYVHETHPNVNITSCDDNVDWLNKTTQFIRDNTTVHHSMVEWCKFKQQNNENFDFIFYDLGRIPVRLENMEYVFNLLSKNGIMIIDDVHKPKVHELCKKLCSKYKYTIVTETDADEFGRYSFVVKNET